MLIAHRMRHFVGYKAPGALFVEDCRVTDGTYEQALSPGINGSIQHHESHTVMICNRQAEMLSGKHEACLNGDRTRCPSDRIHEEGVLDAHDVVDVYIKTDKPR
ncbi:hypothetical protein MSA03_26690 [Microbacterium saccharophilum]|nr:hypothetical protein MSA03_26690 [Microbacterium saccharophilum]